MPNDLFSQYQSKLQPLGQQSQKLLTDYLALQAQAPTFQSRLMDAIKKAGQYPSAMTMREEYMRQPNLTPMAIEALVSKRGQTERGSIQDIMSRAYGGFQQDILQKQGLAQTAQQQRQNLLQEYGLAQQARAPLTLGEGQTLFDPITMQPIFKAPKTYKGETTPDLSWLMSILGGEGLGAGVPAGPGPSEPKPTTRPTRRGVTYSSPRGEWMWDWETEDWYPVTD